MTVTSLLICCLISYPFVSFLVLAGSTLDIATDRSVDRMNEERERREHEPICEAGGLLDVGARRTTLTRFGAELIHSILDSRITYQREYPECVQRPGGRLLILDRFATHADDAVEFVGVRVEGTAGKQER